MPDPTPGLRLQAASEIQRILRGKLSELGLSQRWNVKVMGYVNGHPAIVIWTDEGHRETTGTRMGVYFALLDSLDLAPHDKTALQIKKVNPGIELQVVWVPTLLQPQDVSLLGERPEHIVMEVGAAHGSTLADAAEWIFQTWGTFYLNPVSTR